MNSLQITVLLFAISFCSKVACLDHSLSGTSSTPMAEATSSQPIHRNTTDSSSTDIGSGISPVELDGSTDIGSGISPFELDGSTDIGSGISPVELDGSTDIGSGISPVELDGSTGIGSGISPVELDGSTDIGSGISPFELSGITNSSQATGLTPIPATQENYFFSSDYVNSIAPSSTRSETTTTVSGLSVPFDTLSISLTPTPFVTGTTESPYSDVSDTTQVIDPPTSEPPAKGDRLCYKKHYWSNIPTTCEAGPHGCFEIERDPKANRKRMGCLNKPCKPLKTTKAIRQCCNTSLCNDLHKRPSLFVPDPPTLSPLSAVLQQSGGYIICDSPTHQEESCYSMYGCYTLRDYNTGLVLNRTCIRRPDFKPCLQPVTIYAKCCYEYHYCNRRPPPAEEIPNPTQTNAITEAALNTTAPTETRSATEPAPMAIAPSETVIIVIMVVLIIVALVISASILACFGVYGYRHYKRERPVRPAPMPRPYYPPPVGADESQTVTMPVEMIR